MLGLAVSLAYLPALCAAPVLTPFRPDKHGLNFDNNFKNNAVPEFNLKTYGLCGGMCYAALDYYFKQTPVPAQDYRPAGNTVLERYLFQRQMDALAGDWDKWTELTINPMGARNAEFFNWGLLGNARIGELRSYLDRQKPVTLGLHHGDVGKCHYVVAIGYEMGRYKGDLGAYKEDFKIIVYDPNAPNSTRTLIAQPGKLTYTFAEDKSVEWRTYFVDGKYATKVPPPMPAPNYPADNLIRQLLLTFTTGAFELRGGPENINVVLKTRSGESQAFNNANLGARWMVGDTQTACFNLSKPVARVDLASLTVSTTAGFNWDMMALKIRAIGGGGLDLALAQHPFKPFRPSDRTLTLPLAIRTLDPVVAARKVDRILVTARTGTDDLRGGQDNLSMTVVFRDNTQQVFPNVNASKRWAEAAEGKAILSLSKAVSPEDIVVVQLMKPGPDSWSMSSLRLSAVGEGRLEEIGSHGPFYFTPKTHTLVIPTKVPEYVIEK